MLTARLTGDWDRLRGVFNTLPGQMQRAGTAALREEGEHLRAEMVAGIASGAPGGYPFAPLSPLTLLLGGGGRPMMRSRALVWSIVVTEERGGVFVGIRGDRVKIAQLHAAGASYRRTLSPRQRRWFFGALRRAGQTPTPGAGVGMVRLPPRPIVGPVISKAFGGGFAMGERLRKSFARNMGGVLGTA
ncbi:MAG: hypothetical protein EKK55_25010 [Rhodocyclaceae bacterium]|nr:MAG: hypothetical protein EKK55_25010 [Rhodocyclaceae bacterium]